MKMEAAYSLKYHHVVKRPKIRIKEKTSLVPAVNVTANSEKTIP
jgi:hypothetical protein